MGDEVEASAQRVRDHLRRTHHPERKLTDTEVGSTVNLTLPFFVRARSGSQLNERSGKLRDAILSVYPEAHSTAIKLQAVLELRLGTALTDDEVTYLTLHVARMVDEDR